jgi:hypothetical protein
MLTTSKLAIIRSNKSSSDPDQPHRSAFPAAPPQASNVPNFDMKSLNPAQRRKMVMLKGKRERLERELARMG